MKRLDQLTQLTAAQLAQDDIIGIRDQSAGQTKYITVKDLTGSPDNGWQATGESWTFSSWTLASRLGIVTVPTDATTKYSVGMWVRFSQTTGGTKWGKILAVTATTLSIYLPGQILNNETITSPVYSTVATPVGLPVSVSRNEPYKFAAYLASDTSTATGAKIPFNTIDYDTGNNFNTSTNRFVAPVSGYYQITGVQRKSVAVSTYVQIALYKNGVLYQYGGAFGSFTSAGSYGSMTVMEMYLNAGDYIEAYDQGGSTSNTTSGISASRLSGRYISS